MVFIASPASFFLSGVFQPAGRRRADAFILLGDKTTGPLSARRRGDSWRSNPHPSKAERTSRRSFLRGPRARVLSQDHLRATFPDFSLGGPSFPRPSNRLAGSPPCTPAREADPTGGHQRFLSIPRAQSRCARSSHKDHR